MSDFFLGTGAVIATYIGTFISIGSAIAAFCAKSEVEKYRDELKIRIQDKELSKLIEMAKNAKIAAHNFSSKKTKTSAGQKKEDADRIIEDFLTELNENVHLIKSSKIRNLYKTGKGFLDNNKYDDLFYNISDIISILKKLTDSNITRE